MYTSSEISNYIVDKAFKENITIDKPYMKLNKLIYLCHGWHLSILDEPLITDAILAYPYGPLCIGHYSLYTMQLNDREDLQPLLLPIYHNGNVSIYIPELRPNTKELVDRVLEVYKKYTAIQLSNLSHGLGTAWYKATKNGSIYGFDLPDNLIKEEFDAQKVKNANNTK